MKNVYRIIRNDIKGLFRSALALLLIAAILILPALYAWLNIYASWDPYENISGIPVAIYTADKDYVLDDGTVVNMSDSMLANLKNESDIGWTVVDTEEEAINGVYDGTYYASVVIKEDFTQSMFDLDNVDENEPTITFYQNQKKNAIATRMTDSACNTLKRCLSRSYISALMLEVFGHFNGWNSDITDLDGDVDTSKASFNALKKNMNDYQSSISAFIKANKYLVSSVNETDDLVDDAVSSINGSVDNINKQNDLIRQMQQDMKSDVDDVSDSLTDIQGNLTDLEEITTRIGNIDTISNMTQMLTDVRVNLKQTRELLKNIQKVIDAAQEIDDDADTISDAMCDSMDYLLGQTDNLLDYVDENYDEMVQFSEDLTYVLGAAVKNDPTIASDYSFLVNNCGYESGATTTYVTAILLASNGINLTQIYQQGYAAGGAEGGSQAVASALQGAVAMTQGKSDAELLSMALGAVAANPIITGADSSVMTRVGRLSASAASVMTSMEKIQTRAGAIKKQYENINKNLPGALKNAGLLLEDLGFEAGTDTMRAIQIVIQSDLDDTISKLEELENLGSGESSATREDILEAKIKVANTKIEIDAIRLAFKAINVGSPDVDADDAIVVIDHLIDNLDDIQKALDSAQKLIDTTGDASEVIATVRTLASDTQTYINDTLWPEVNALMNDMEAVMDEISDLLVHASSTIKDSKGVLNGVSVSMMGANNSLSTMQDVLKTLSGQISPLIDDIEEIQDAEIISDIRELMGLDPDAVSEYFASPVDTYTDSVYSIDNYGSGMAPFYTSLAIWIGVIIVGAIFKVKPDRRGLRKPRTWQLFLGRYFLFFVLNQLQMLIIVLGDLFILKIQCEHPIMFILTGALTSAVFSVLIYALILCFGILGKAASIVLFILQIACSGGTYPVELLPTQFRALHKFLPFDYSIGAMRSCIAGIYQHDLAACYLVLFMIIAVSVFIGLNSRTFRGFTDYMEEQMEESKLIS